ncbi:MAG: O-methyltransferase [Flavobacteriales bacterium]|nr:O-methyltransferase [Flavobacteriales bacterium]MCZ2442294.1 O-methyltransferase [Flavobacteriales bacterium]
MDFISPEIEDYALQHSSPESDVLQSLNRETHARVLYARMLSGHLQGKFLEMISSMLSPKRILEIGTYTGYSAINLAKGLCPDGILHTIDVNDELEGIIRKSFTKAGLSESIHLHLGNALDIIPQLKEIWDLVFIDADKENYRRYYELIFERVRPGGIIIADNVLWSGKVLDEAYQDAETRAIRAFNQFVMQDNRVENLLLPIRDGLMIIRKK